MSGTVSVFGGRRGVDHLLHEAAGLLSVCLSVQGRKSLQFLTEQSASCLEKTEHETSGFPKQVRKFSPKSVHKQCVLPAEGLLAYVSRPTCPVHVRERLPSSDGKIIWWKV